MKKRLKGCGAARFVRQSYLLDPVTVAATSESSSFEVMRNIREMVSQKRRRLKAFKFGGGC